MSAAAAGRGLRVERDGPIAWLTLDRPDRRNAIDRAMRSALAAAATALEADREVRVVVLTGAGTAFCAGTDMKEPPPSEPVHPLVEPSARITAAIESITKPVIAAVNGPAAGGGFELVLAAEIRVAATTATFSVPEVRVGSLPGSGGTQRLFAALPEAIAWKMLLTGQPIDAAEALRVGLVSDVVEPGALRDAALAIALSIAEAAPLSAARGESRRARRDGHRPAPAGSRSSGRCGRCSRPRRTGRKVARRSARGGRPDSAVAEGASDSLAQGRDRGRRREPPGHVARGDSALAGDRGAPVGDRGLRDPQGRDRRVAHHARDGLAGGFEALPRPGRAPRRQPELHGIDDARWRDSRRAGPDRGDGGRDRDGERGRLRVRGQRAIGRQPLRLVRRGAATRGASGVCSGTRPTARSARAGTWRCTARRASSWAGSP